MEVWSVGREAAGAASGPGARTLHEVAARLATQPSAAWEWIERRQESHAAEERRSAGRQRGAVATPASVAEAMACRLLEGWPRGSRVRVLDAGCGSGRLLTAAVRCGAARGLRLSCEGMEIDAAAARWARALEPVVRAGAGEALVAWRVRCADFLFTKVTGPGFDAAIANPPYVSLRRLEPAYRDKLRARLGPLAQGDLAALFVSRMLRHLRPGGRLCVIVPNKLLAAGYAAPLRRELLETTCVEEIWDLSEGGVFDGCGAYPVVVVASRRAAGRRHRIVIRAASGAVRARWPLPALRGLPEQLLPLGLPPAAMPLALRLLAGTRLEDVASVGCGIATSGFGKAIGAGDERILCSGDVRAFGLGAARRFAPERAGIAPATLARQRVAKVVVPGMFRRLRAAYDGDGHVLGRVYFIPVEGASAASRAHRRALLLALLNSRLYAVLYNALFAGVSQAGGYVRLNAPYLRCMPWPGRETHPDLVRLVRAMERGAADGTRERLEAVVESLFDLEPGERRLLARLERDLIPAGSSPGRLGSARYGSLHGDVPGA